MGSGFLPLYVPFHRVPCMDTGLPWCIVRVQPQANGFAAAYPFMGSCSRRVTRRLRSRQWYQRCGSINLVRRTGQFVGILARRLAGSGRPQPALRACACYGWPYPIAQYPSVAPRTGPFLTSCAAGPNGGGCCRECHVWRLGRNCRRQ